MKRIIVACTVAFFVGVAACHRMPGTSVSAGAAPTDREPFVGSIRQIRDGFMLWLDEESPTSSRRGNIWLAPATEITLRNGSLLAATDLRRGMRAKVWFSGAVDVTTSSVSGTAQRIVVDY